MNSETIEYIGYLAAFCTSLSFIPQAWLVYRYNSTEGISLYMFLVFCFGLIAWLLYGILLNSTPIIWANGVTLTFAGYILIKKIQHLSSSNKK
jgi:MtN3 and saliva related transmembrane protein